VRGVPLRLFRSRPTSPAALERDRTRTGQGPQLLGIGPISADDAGPQGSPPPCPWPTPPPRYNDGKVLAEAASPAAPRRRRSRCAWWSPRGASKLFEQEKDFDLAADSNAALKLEGAPESAIDTRESASYRYDLTVTAGRDELLQLPFHLRPSEQRPWLGDTIVKSSEAENIYVLIDPSKGRRRRNMSGGSSSIRTCPPATSSA